MRTLAACLLLLLPTAAAADTAVLRAAVSVPTGIVHIGDLVERAGLAADVPVFRAPDLGETGAVPVERVLAALRPHGVVSVDTRGLYEVSVTRASRLVGQTEFERAVAVAVAERQGLRPGDVQVGFDRAMAAVHVEPDATAEPRVTRLAYDARSGRFDVGFEVPGSPVARRLALRASGSAVETVEAVVVVRAVGRGETLRPGDVTVQRRPRGELGADGFLSADSARGMAARRQLRAGQTLGTDDVMKPDIVVRNEPVTLMFTVPGLVVTTRGRAMTSGAEGELVSVANLQTKRILQGVVTGPGQVTVSAGAQTGQLAQADPATTGTASRPTPVRTETIRPAAAPAAVR